MTRVSKALLLAFIAALVVSAQVDPGLLKMVPPDAKIICGVHVDSAKASPFGVYVLSQIQTGDAGFQKFVTSTGFNPATDVHEVLSAASGTSAQHSGVVLATGNFQTEAIAKAAQSNGATASTYGAFSLLTHPDKKGDTGAIALTSNIAILGKVADVQAAIDRSQTASALPSDVITKMTALSMTNDAWFLSTGPITDFFAGKVADPNLGGALQGNLLQAILQADGGINFSPAKSPGNVLVSGEAVARSDKDAQSLGDVIKFLAGMVQLNKDSNPQTQKLATLLDTLPVSASGSTMTLSLAIPESMIEQLFVPPAARVRVHHAARGAAGGR